MNQRAPIEPLDFDLDQWKSDVQTFLKETVTELGAIVGELTGQENEVNDALDFRKPDSVFSPAKFEESTKTSRSNSDDPTGSRLSDLKEMLASQMSKPARQM